MAAFLASLAFAGRVLLWLLLASLILLAVFLLVPVSVWLRYETEEFTVRAGIGPLRIRVWPQKTLTEEQQRKKDEKKRRREERKARKAAKKKKPQKPKEVQNAPPRKKAKLTLEAVCKLVSASGRLLGRVLGALHFDHIRIRFAVRGNDAADTAITVGKANAWLYGVLGFLSNHLQLKFDEIHIEPAFLEIPQGYDSFSCQVSARLVIMLIAGAAFVYTLFKEKLIDLFL